MVYPVEKKDVERAQLEVFCQLFPNFPVGEIAESEEPDFLVTTGAGVIGLELTDLYWDAPTGQRPRKSQESVRYQVCERARDEWRAAGFPPVHVAVHFSENRELKKCDVELLARSVVDVAHRNLPDQEGSAEESYGWTNRNSFPEELDTVSVYRLDVLTKAHFSAPDAAFIPDLHRGDVERALRSKEPKYTNYRKKADEVWLLVNINGAPLSTTFDAVDDAVNATYRSSYDRVFILVHSDKKLCELSLE